MMEHLPIGWVECQLHDVFQPRRVRVSPQEFSDMPFIGMDHVESATMRVVGRGLAGEMKSACFRFYQSDVIYGRLRPYLNKVAVPGFDGLASGEFIVFPPSEAVIPYYLAYRLSASDFVAFASRLDEGDRPRVSFQQIGSFPLTIPPLAEQRAVVAKIDALFSELDKGIEQLHTIKQQLKQYRQAVLKAAFEGRLTAAWRAEQQAEGTLPSADELLERIEKEREARYQQRLDEWKQAVDEWQADGGRESGRRRPSKPSVPKALSDLTEAELGSLYVLPGEWRWVRLGQLCESVRNGISDKPSDSPPGFPILRISAVRPMYVDLSEARYHDRPRGEVETFLIRNGDLLFTRYNGSLHLVGVCGMVRGCNASILHPDKLIRVALAAPSIVSAFVELAANSGVSRDFVVSRARTTAGQTGISGEDVRNIPLPLPSLPELERIVDELSFRLSMLDELEKAVDYATNRAEALRRSILRKAFEGRLLSEAESTDVRNDPEYEPADKLLERIRAAGGTGKQPSRPDRARKRAHPMRPSCPRGNAAETGSEEE